MRDRRDPSFSEGSVVGIRWSDSPQSSSAKRMLVASALAIGAVIKRRSARKENKKAPGGGRGRLRRDIEVGPAERQEQEHV